MDDVPICPPYWPWIVWHHIHNPPSDGRKIDPALVAKLNDHFAAVSIVALAGQLTNREIGKAIGAAALKTGAAAQPEVAGLLG